MVKHQSEELNTTELKAHLQQLIQMEKSNVQIIKMNLRAQNIISLNQAF